jgi:enolase
MSTTIQSLHAREILDSRGNPTVAVRATLSDGATAEAMIPSGASTGEHEAVELRDNDPKRYHGKGVLTAVQNVNTEIVAALTGMDAENQRALDEKMITLDGTENKARLGANAILGASLAVARAVAVSRNVELFESLRTTFNITRSTNLPYPMMNIVNGGVHANNGLTFQEFMVVPQQIQFAERIRCGSEIFHTLKKLLDEKGQSTGVGDEGGFAPDFHKNEDALQCIAEAIAKTAYTLGTDVMIALDPAISEFYKDGVYTLDDNKWNAEQVTDYMERIAKEYSIRSIEDGLAENDWEGWQQMTTRLGSTTQLVGDDLFVTNQKFLQKGIDMNVANAILIKVNQIGTLTETMDTIALAQEHDYKIIVSHRSGETEDTTIADIAVAVGAEFIKTGSLSRSERIAKYNRLLAIEALLT